MKNESPDDRLTRLLREQRLADEASAPDLARLLERLPVRPNSRAPYWLILSAGAVAAVVALVAVILLVRPPGPSSPTGNRRPIPSC